LDDALIGKVEHYFTVAEREGAYDRLRTRLRFFGFLMTTLSYQNNVLVLAYSGIEDIFQR